MGTFRHPIQVVSRLTGLSPHVIRIWEKRYSAVVPSRTKTNRRLYSDEEVDRLRLLARATEAGHKIGLIAGLGLSDLRTLVELVAPASNGHELPTGLGPRPMELKEDARRSRHLGQEMPETGEELSARGGAASLVETALRATSTFDAEGLVKVLEEATVRLGGSGVLCRVVGPLAQTLGDRWQRGDLMAAHEHFASAIIRDFLSRASRPFATGESSPRAVVATPAGQMHELGAVMVGALATHLGWRSIYLGASLPSAEIAGAAIQNGARAVLLSLVYPADDPELAGELRQLRRLLPTSVEVIAGGRAAKSYGSELREIGARISGDLEELCHQLDELRTGRVTEPQRLVAGGAAKADETGRSQVAG